MNQLIPRQPKRKRQPTAECMREQLRLAADEIIRLRTIIAHSPVHGAFLPPGWVYPQGCDPVGGFIDAATCKRPRLPWWRRFGKSA